MGKTSLRAAAYAGPDSGPGPSRPDLSMRRCANETPARPQIERHVMSVKTSEEARNEQVIRSLYALAEGNAKDTSKFVSMFSDDGYFYDVSAGKKYFGAEIGVTVDVYAAAFPDMHRELYALRSFGDHVVVELSLNGTHKGDLVLPAGTISPTGKEMHAPCCDVFRLKDGKVFSFHCYVAVPILLEQLGVFMNLQAALRH
jgi:ketosteroid isomerase-like protein